MTGDYGQSNRRGWLCTAAARRGRRWGYPAAGIEPPPPTNPLVVVLVRALYVPFERSFGPATRGSDFRFFLSHDTTNKYTKA